jgi:hypothetical protein
MTQSNTAAPTDDQIIEALEDAYEKPGNEAVKLMRNLFAAPQEQAPADKDAIRNAALEEVAVKALQEIVDMSTDGEPWVVASEALSDIRALKSEGQS